MQTVVGGGGKSVDRALGSVDGAGQPACIMVGETLHSSTSRGIQSIARPEMIHTVFVAL